MKAGGGYPANILRPPSGLGFRIGTVILRLPAFPVAETAAGHQEQESAAIRISD